MLMAALKAKPYPWNTNTNNFLFKLFNFSWEVGTNCSKANSVIFSKNTLAFMKIWRWLCSRYLRNHSFFQREQFHCLKFRHTEVIHKKIFLSFVEMHNYVWHLWTCTSQNIRFHNFWKNWPRAFFWEIDYSYFCQTIVLHHSKMLKFKKKLYRESS